MGWFLEFLDECARSNYYINEEKYKEIEGVKKKIKELKKQLLETDASDEKFFKITQALEYLEKRLEQLRRKEG